LYSNLHLVASRWKYLGDHQLTTGWAMDFCFVCHHIQVCAHRPSSWM